MTEYIALIRKEDGTDYGVDFPDFPGCVTAGSDLDEALANSREALALHIEGLADAGEDIPEASTLEAVMADPHNAGTVCALVPAPPAKRRSVRFNATMDEGLLDLIDNTATATGMTRSGFLSAAARSALVPTTASKAKGGKRRRAKVKTGITVTGKGQG